MIIDRYYYNRLPDSEKIIYKEIYQGCMEHKDIIPITANEEELTKSYARIVSAISDDNPLLYFVNQSVLDFATDGNGNYVAAPQYYFSKENVAKYNAKIQDAANKLIYDLKLTEGTELDKVRKVHDYMCQNVAYDFEGSDIKQLNKYISAHNIIGVFAHKKAQCEGIAKAAKVLLNAVDVKCIYVSGKAAGMDGMDNHGWNIVSIDGNPYHMDITMDIGASSDGLISYDNYNLTDSQIRRTHVFSTGYPKCTATEANYFVGNDLVFSSKKKIQEYISRSLKSGNMEFYFKLAGKLKAAEIYQEMTDYAYSILCGMGKENVKAVHVVNGDMNTCRIIFA